MAVDRVGRPALAVAARLWYPIDEATYQGNDTPSHVHWCGEASGRARRVPEANTTRLVSDTLALHPP
jgi:hypothetical protein